MDAPQILDLSEGRRLAYHRTPAGGEGAGRPGVYTVVYEYAQRDEGIAAGDLGLRLLCSLLPEAIRPAGSVPEGWTWPEARDEFIRFAQRRALGPSTASLVKAAETRGIPRSPSTRVSSS
jgi:cyanophycin synthetase